MDVDANYCPDIKSRWKSYGNYKILLWAWMMNEITIVFSPTDISHNGFYAPIALQSLAIVFIGMPLVYSEICLAQYTNCNILTMWNYFPLFQNVGYGTLYLIILKAIYVLVLTSWYMVYTFHSAMEAPPWFSCEDFNDTKCMVKRVNVSVFQHCLEAQLLFEDDCGMKTASRCFFEREIGDNCTLESFECIYSWKKIVAVTVICSTVFILSIKNEKNIQIVTKLVAVYVCIVVLILFCVALSTSGTWYSTKINWNILSFRNSYTSLARGFLSLGTGYGIIIFLSRDVPFRSPAAMTSIYTPLLSLFVSFMFGLIAFGGIKTMSYYHGKEENVIEIGYSVFFPMFASMSEILSYFDAMPVWGFLWFNVVFDCLFINFWILYLFLKELVLTIDLARKYSSLSCMILMLIIIGLSLPFQCSDLTGALTDATEIIQILNNFLFSVSMYWIYGYNNHNVDIVFMIGIKASYFCKIIWIINPLLILYIFYSKLLNIDTGEVEDSHVIKSINTSSDMLLFYIILTVYLFIIIVGMITQLVSYHRQGKLSDVISPIENWGPRDKILFKSRQMFVPGIMTREFLYRRVRIQGYNKRQKIVNVQKDKEEKCDESMCEMTWSALTSN